MRGVRLSAFVRRASRGGTANKTWQWPRPYPHSYHAMPCHRHYRQPTTADGRIGGEEKKRGKEGTEKKMLRDTEGAREIGEQRIAAAVAGITHAKKSWRRRRTKICTCLA